MTLEEAKREIEDWMFSSGDVYSISRNSEDKAVGDALSDVLGLLDEVKPVENPDPLTLTELAHELRNIFKFRYLTVDYDYPASLMSMWDEKPEFGFSCWDRSTGYLGDFSTSALNIELNLSEYADENGDIDYSKCIVEVE